MLIQGGCKLTFNLPSQTPMLAKLYLHPFEVSKLRTHETLTTDPPITIEEIQDEFGNRVARMVLPPGQISIKIHAIVEDSARPDEVNSAAYQHSIQDLPPDVLPFLLGSRYCEVDRLYDTACHYLVRLHQVGNGCRQFVIGCITRFSSAMNILG